MNPKFQILNFKQDEQGNRSHPRNLSRLAAATVFIFFFLCVDFFASGGGEYFPAAVGDVWYYEAYKRGEESKVYHSLTSVKKTEFVDGKEYLYFRTPMFDVSYLMRKDEKGVYTRVIRFPFLAFSITVDILPEMQTLSFPLYEGKKWSHKGKGETIILGIFKISRDISAEFEAVKKEKINTAAGEFEAYHIRAMIDQGDGEKKLKKYWYAKGVGFAISDNENDVLQVTGYRLIKDGKTVENIPPGAEKYK